MFFAAGLDCGLGRLVKLCGARRRRKTAMRFPLGSPRAVRPGRPVVRRLAYEQLEDRRLLAVTVVDTLLDAVDPNDGVTSLREAIAETNARPGADEIRFNARALWEKYCAPKRRVVAAIECLTDLAARTEKRMSFASYRDHWHSKALPIALLVHQHCSAAISSSMGWEALWFRSLA